MRTEIYFIRHSEPMSMPINVVNSDNLQISNEKGPLSVNGEKRAERLSKTSEMKNIDLVISSSYVRALSTAKYIALENNKDLHINELFGERKFGINSWDEMPKEFGTKQMMDPHFKVGNGESRAMVADRMYNALYDVLKENVGKRVAIVSHSTAITFLFMKLGQHKDDRLYFKDKIVIDKDFKWDAPEVFKLTFENNELVDIQNLKLLG